MEAQRAPTEAISKISFCNVCGDSLLAATCCERHCRNPPPECLHVAPETADVKRRETQVAHDALHDVFKARVMTGGNNRNVILTDQGEVSGVLEEAHWGAELGQRSLKHQTLQMLTIFHLSVLFCY